MAYVEIIISACGPFGVHEGKFYFVFFLDKVEEKRKMFSLKKGNSLHRPRFRNGPDGPPTVCTAPNKSRIPNTNNNNVVIRYGIVNRSRNAHFQRDVFCRTLLSVGYRKNYARIQKEQHFFFFF